MFEIIATIFVCLLLIKFAFRAGALQAREQAKLQQQYDEAQQQLKRLDRLLAEQYDTEPPPKKKGNVVDIKSHNDK